MASKIKETVFFLVWTVVTILVSYWLGQSAYSWLPPQATLEAQKIDGLFSFLVALGSVIFLGIFGMITFALLTCGAERGDFSEGHPARSSTKLELLWTATPTLLVLWIALQGHRIYSLLDIEGLSNVVQKPSEAAVMVSDTNRIAQVTAPETIRVVAKQWAWAFYYPEQDLTSTELHLPANRRIRLALLSEDVLHGFYIPAFRIKQDIIPNKEVDLMISPIREGQYQLRDSQFSGTYFSLMEADVYVESPADYQQWLSQAKSAYPVSNLASSEYDDPPNLLGQRWATTAPAPLSSPFIHASANSASRSKLTPSYQP